MAVADAASAIQVLAGSTLDGRTLKVNEAQPKAPRQPHYQAYSLTRTIKAPVIAGAFAGDRPVIFWI